MIKLSCLRARAKPWPEGDPDLRVTIFAEKGRKPEKTKDRGLSMIKLSKTQKLILALLYANNQEPIRKSHLPFLVFLVKKAMRCD